MTTYDHPLNEFSFMCGYPCLKDMELTHDGKGSSRLRCPRCKRLIYIQ